MTLGGRLRTSVLVRHPLLTDGLNYSFGRMLLNEREFLYIHTIEGLRGFLLETFIVTTEVDVPYRPEVEGVR